MGGSQFLPTYETLHKHCNCADFYVRRNEYLCIYTDPIPTPEPGSNSAQAQSCPNLEASVLPPWTLIPPTHTQATRDRPTSWTLLCSSIALHSQCIIPVINLTGSIEKRTAHFSPHGGSGPRQIRIKNVVKEPVDENDSAVMDLVSAGYTMDQSIDAVARFGTLEAALNHLEALVEEDEDVETDLIPTAFHQQFSRENSQEENMDW